MSAFDEVKARVSCADAAPAYGYMPNRAGYICCPFHSDKTPSMKLYPGAGGFYCFGCGAHGSVIDFVARLFDIEPIAALRRLNEDFSLALQLDKPENSEEQERRRDLADVRRRFEEWREKTLILLNASFRSGYRALRDKPPDAWTDGEALAIKWLPTLEAQADALDGESVEKQMIVFRDRKEVERICKRILNGSPPRSMTA